jgi:hypothetical protein
MSMHWYERFIRRNASIATRMAEPLARKRRQAMDPAHIAMYFEKLRDVIKRNHITAERIIMLDETGFQREGSKTRRVVGIAGARSVYTAGGNNATQHVSVCGIHNALGDRLSAVVITTGQRITEAEVEGVGDDLYFCKSASGGMEPAIFNDVLTKVILKHVEPPPTPENKLLVIIDSHYSHHDLSTIELCITNHVELLSYEPNSTYALQPPDVGLFAPFKAHMRAEQAAFFDEHPHGSIAMNALLQMISRSYAKSFSVDAVKNAVAACGIWPVDPSRVKRMNALSKHTDTRTLVHALPLLLYTCAAKLNLSIPYREPSAATAARAPLRRRSSVGTDGNVAPADVLGPDYVTACRLPTPMESNAELCARVVLMRNLALGAALNGQKKAAKNGDSAPPPGKKKRAPSVDGRATLWTSSTVVASLREAEKERREAEALKKSNAEARKRKREKNMVEGMAKDDAKKRKVAGTDVAYHTNAAITHFMSSAAGIELNMKYEALLRKVPRTSGVPVARRHPHVAHAHDGRAAPGQGARLGGVRGGEHVDGGERAAAHRRRRQGLPSRDARAPPTHPRGRRRQLLLVHAVHGGDGLDAAVGRPEGGNVGAHD